jgi:hypothetical protein
MRKYLGYLFAELLNAQLRMQKINVASQCCGSVNIYFRAVILTYGC